MNRSGTHLILGLTGRAGAGKDTVADILCEVHQFYRFAFAGPLRDEIIDAFRIDPSLFRYPYKEQKVQALAIDNSADRDFVVTMRKRGKSITAARSPREIMQWWGTEYRRGQQPQYWTRKAEDTLHDALKRGFDRIVITDVRLANEAEFVRYHGGKIWRVRRATAEQIAPTHQSEALDSIEADLEIDNNRSMTSLVAGVMQAYADLTNAEQVS